MRGVTLDKLRLPLSLVLLALMLYPRYRSSGRPLKLSTIQVSSCIIPDTNIPLD